MYMEHRRDSDKDKEETYSAQIRRLKDYEDVCMGGVNTRGKNEEERKNEGYTNDWEAKKEGMREGRLEGVRGCHMGCLKKDGM